MAEIIFKIGDVVKLKSGGMSMTVEKTSRTPNCVECIWFSENKLNRETFNTAVLEKEKPLITTTTITEKF